MPAGATTWKSATSSSACRGLRLYPKWHNYALADPCAEELISAAVERSLPVSIPFRVEDYRQRSWLVDVPDIPPAEVVDLVKKHPKGRFLPPQRRRPERHAAGPSRANCRPTT
ncbi:MAG: hypothetical protein ACOX1P_07800 [Thermoguttaceae bacterium]